MDPQPEPLVGLCVVGKIVKLESSFGKKSPMYIEELGKSYPTTCMTSGLDGHGGIFHLKIEN